MRNILKWAVSILWLAPAAALATPILNVGSGGQLTSASNVNVDGSFYDVEFVEGDCYAVYDGCNEEAFAITTQELALTASAALLAQVFTDFAINGLGNFDSSPLLTTGCTWTTLCGALTPYQIGFGVRYATAENNSNESLDRVSTGATSFAFDRADTVWAVWTAATPTALPEPSAISLLALGLACMVYRLKRRKPLSC